MHRKEPEVGPLAPGIYTYAISAETTPGTMPASTLPGVKGMFDIALPVDDTTFVRKLFAGDTITFDVDPSWVFAEMHIKPTRNSLSSELPFDNVTSPFSVLPTASGNLTLTVNEVLGAWQIWFRLRNGANGKYVIADPEVQTQTGGGGGGLGGGG